MTHTLRYAARSDRGLVRANNQDSLFAGDRLLVIADGMGGHAAGDVASRLVVAAFVDLDQLPAGSDMIRPLNEATREGNAAIAEMVDEKPEYDGMGTTLTALLFDGPVVALAHVGDSRAYLFRNGVLHQISHDDTFVQSLVDDLRITSDEAAHHPQRSLLLRALNGTELDPSITMREISPGDRFLICSDGLSDVVSPESIADALAGEDPDSIADNLIQLALVAGGPDNVSVIVADVVDTGNSRLLGAPGGVLDPDATGPIQPIHLTQRMPRVPLPPIPEDVPAKPVYAVDDDDPAGAVGADGRPPPAGEFDDRDFDDRDFDDRDFDGQELDDQDVADPGRRDGAPAWDGVERRARASVDPGQRRPGTGSVRASEPRRGRRLAFALALVVLLGVGLTGSYLLANSNYYVGADGEQVAVFKGVNGSVLGLRFASVQENSCSSAAPGCAPLKVGDLVQSARDQVTAGIPVATLQDARGVMVRLNGQQLPLCPAPSTPGSTTTGGTTAGSPPSSGSSATGPSTTGPSTTGPATTGPATSGTAGSGPLSRPVSTAGATKPATGTPKSVAPKPAPVAPAPVTPKTVTPGAAKPPTVKPTAAKPPTVKPTAATPTAAKTAAAKTAAVRPLPAKTAAVRPLPAKTTPVTPAPAKSAPVSGAVGSGAAQVTSVLPSTVTSTGSASTTAAAVTPSPTGTPLVSPPAQPGVNCRLAG